MEESITKRKHGRPLKEKPKDGRYSGQYPSKGSSQTSFDYEFKQVGKNSFELLNVDDLECPICIEMVTEPVRLRCNHLLCRECFEKLVELSSRKCPKCRKWIGGTRQISNLLDTSLWNFIRKKFIHDQIESDRLLALDLVRKERRELYFRFRRESYVLRSSISSQDSSFGENNEDKIEYKKRKAASDVTDAAKVEAKKTVEDSTGKSLFEVLILASTIPQYDKRLFIDLPVLYIMKILPQMKTTSSEHVVYINCSECQNKNKKPICVHKMF